MNIDTFHQLRAHAIIDKVELINSQLVMGEFDLFLSPQQMRAARALGLDAPSAVDAVLSDEEALAELLKRLEDSGLPLHRDRPAPEAAEAPDRPMAVRSPRRRLPLPRFTIRIELEPTWAWTHADARRAAQRAAEAIEGLFVEAPAVADKPLLEIRNVRIERLSDSAD
jgi:hypothetical protein